MGAGVDAWIYASHMCREWVGLNPPMRKDCSPVRQSQYEIGLVSYAYYRTITQPHIITAHSTLNHSDTCHNAKYRLSSL